MSDYYKDTPPLEFISDVYDIMKDGDNLTPERLAADVVDMLCKYLSAQQGGEADRMEACATHTFCYPSKTDPAHFTCGCEVPTIR